VDTIRIGRVECRFSRRQGEDKPTVTRIHGLEPENVAKKCAVRFGVFTVDNYVSARKSFIPPKNHQETHSSL